ncbi:hypothetical protein AVEN_260610-1 [Araneus ventricosus]|uniref:Uncharacterized protein n=1 Tax=Araneus ventricosus TaxID=182803 RepID=A0A4Y2A4D5_ARAVE|nr:hypothetical protein AVEN_234930-1 [Araneus ventricosus]GBL74711.1 hypothetical protein AVEN_260610-1 [Araneus ventricosus]
MRVKQQISSKLCSSLTINLLFVTMTYKRTPSQLVSLSKPPIGSYQNWRRLGGSCPVRLTLYPDSTYVCSKFGFYLILPCHGKFDASSLKRTCGKLTMQNRHPRSQNEFATSSP